jgi:transposase
MSESIPPIPADQKTVKPCRRRFLDEFKRDAVRLITDQQYTFQAAAQAVGVSQKSLRDWHRKFATVSGVANGAAVTVEQLQADNKRLRQQLKRAETEREILKKATTYFASQQA